MFLQFKDLSIK